MKKGLLFLLTVLSVNVFAQAFESFNFTGLATANGWTAHSGTTGAITAITTPSGSGNSLSYPGLASSVGNRVSMSASNAEDINKPVSVTGTTYYFSFLLNVTDLSNMNATGSYFIHLGANNSTNQFQIFIPRLYIALGSTATQFKLGMLNTTGGTTATPTYITQEFNPNTTYLVVAKATANAVGDPITASLWVNPIPGAAEPTPGVVNSGGTSGWPTNPILALCLRQSAGIGTFEIDEIRVGTTWASVTPSAASSCVTYNTISAMACNSYTLNSQTYTTSGTYVQTLANANAAGCDSIINLNLMIHNATSSTQNVTYCGPYTLNGQTYTTSGTYTQNLQNIHGCDSTLTLNLNLVGSITYYQDLDNDGYGNAAVTQVGCNPIAGYVTNSTDCNDNNNQIHPGAVDIAGNGIDEDCNGFDAPLQLGIYQFAATVDCATQDVAATNAPANVSFSNFEAQGTACAAGGGVFNRSGWNTTAVLDLNQYNQFTVSGINCTNLNLGKLALNHRTSSTGGTPTIFVRSSLDNYATDIDTIASSWNGNVALADTVLLPAAFSNVSNVTFRFYVINQATSTSTLRMDNVSVWGNQITITPQLYYADQDGDGFGNASLDTLVCNPPAGYVANNTDCNDADALVNPNTVWYQDLDNDQIGNAAVSQTACLQPVGYVLTSGDCNDNDANITAPSMYYVDFDQDGYGDEATGTLFCQAPVNLIPVGGDCDDNNNAINPGATEVCDGVDNNCNGQEDEGLTFLNYYFDGDSDGYGIGNPTVSCTPIAGYATQTGDCDDSNNAINPGAADAEGNAIDENCDGVDGVLAVDALAFESSVAPNPTSAQVQLILNKTIALSIQLLDLNGKVLTTLTTEQKEITLDLSAFENGVYFIELQNAQNKVTHRVIKQ
ncbi:MAG: MopE-related protein [Flavobacteriales bacterium]